MKKILQTLLFVLSLLLLQVSTPAIAGSIMNGPSPDSTVWCHALYHFEPDSADNQMIHFTDVSTSSGTVIGWLWNFGDPASGSSNTSTLQNPVHYFSAPGYYNVCLIINTSDGCTSDKCDVIQIDIWCHAFFSAQPDSANCYMIHFNDESTGSGNVVSWFWNFGDPASGINNVSNLENPVHEYMTAGPYYIAHEITTSDGCTSSIHDTIFIDPPCNAEFHHQAASGNPLEVHFWDPNMPSGSVVYWVWNFGDGSPVVTTPDPWHVFPATGDYNVCLTITTACGSVCDHCETVHVEIPCNAAFEHQADSLDPMTIHFWPVGMPSGSVERWIWDFGDGSPMDTIEFPENPNVTHTYAGAALTHTVCLYIQTISGGDCHQCEEVSVGVPCNAHYHFQAQPGEPLLLHFWDDNMPAGTVAAYEWDFGDGNYGTTPDPWHMYPASGKYNVCLTITTIWGTTCDYCDSITVHSTVDLNGHVLLNGAHADSAMVYLIRIDSVSGMTVIDSTEIQDSSAFYHFGGVLPGSYYTRAILLPSSAYFGDYAPTYFESALLWQDANEINPGGAGQSYNIHMIPEPDYPSGNGTITGNVSEGTKMSAGGTPAPGIVVLILDASDHILYYAITNSEGKFAFPEIATGTYRIYPECPGKVTTPATVSLDQTNLSADLSFVIKGDKILLGINGPATSLLNFVSEIYPNPAVTNASVTISALHETQVILSVVSITGETVLTVNSPVRSGTNRLSWNIPQLNSGIYFVRISDNSGGQVVRKLVVTR